MTSLINLSEQNQIENPSQPASFTNESITNKPQVGVHTRRRASTLADAQNVTQQQSVSTRRTRARNLADSRAGAQPKYKQSPPTVSSEQTNKSPLVALHERRKRERTEQHERGVINPITFVEQDRGATPMKPEHTEYEDEGDWDYPPSPTLNGFSLDEQPTLEDLQQIHDIELQRLQQQQYEQQQQHKNALLQRDKMHKLALMQQKETLLKHSQTVRISGNRPQQLDPIVEQHPQSTHTHTHGTTRREHTPHTPWLHVPREDSPTRSHVSLDFLDAKHHDTRKVANLKHIKIEIVQLVTNSNELDWRKSVTASTAALKTPHLLEGNHRAYTHTKLKELYEKLGLGLPQRYQSPSKQQPTATLKQTQPAWWVEATKTQGDTFAQSATSFTDRLIEQDLRFVVVWVTLGDDQNPVIESEYDSACRTFLFTHMKKSLKAYV